MDVVQKYGEKPLHNAWGFLSPNPPLKTKEEEKRTKPMEYPAGRTKETLETEEGEGTNHRPVNKTSIDTRKMLWKWDATGGRGGKKGNRETDRGGRRGVDRKG